VDKREVDDVPVLLRDFQYFLTRHLRNELDRSSLHP
jgi:hypothetical protein